MSRAAEIRNSSPVQIKIRESEEVHKLRSIEGHPEGRKRVRRFMPLQWLHERKNQKLVKIEAAIKRKELKISKTQDMRSGSGGRPERPLWCVSKGVRSKVGELRLEDSCLFEEECVRLLDRGGNKSVIGLKRSLLPRRKGEKSARRKCDDATLKSLYSIADSHTPQQTTMSTLQLKQRLNEFRPRSNK